MSSRLLRAALASTVGLAAQEPLVEGRAGSPVQVVIYEDLACPDCAAFRKMMDEKLLARYGASVAFLHRDFPLAKHVWARRAAIAGRFFDARKPELGLAWRRHILAHLRETTDSNFNEKLSEFARAHGVNPADAVAALAEARYAEMVEKDFQEGVARGVSKTPTVFVNGEPFIETFTFEEISKGIDEAIGKAK